MRTQRRVLTALTAAAMLLSGGAASVAHAAIGAPGDAAVEVTGVMEVLAHENGASDPADDYRRAVRMPNGERVEVAGGVEARPGDTVSVTAEVPADVQDAARRSMRTTGVGGSVSLSATELKRAEAAPAVPGSALSSATVADAIGDGKPLVVRSSHVLARAQSAGDGPTVHRIVAAIVVPQGVPAQPASASQIAAQVAGARAYWREQSGGKIDLQLEKVAAPYRSAFGCSDDPFQMWTEAARATGFVERPGRHLVMVFPRAATSAGCSYGLASMGSSLGAGGVVYVSDVAWPVLSHEIGHNFGLAHAKSLGCSARTDAAVPSSACQVVEYGDVYDVMGASALNTAGAVSIAQAYRVGLVPQSAVVDVVSGTRRVTLNAVSSLAGVRGVRLQDPRTRATYWVELRTRTGRDARLHAPMAAGVRIVREESATPDNPWSGTMSLDATPTGSSSDFSTTVAPGATFGSYGGGVAVKVAAFNGRTATVDVTVAPNATTLAGARAGLVMKGKPVAKTAPRADARPRAALSPRVAAPAVSTYASGVAAWRGAGASYDVSVRPRVGSSYAKERVLFHGTKRTSARIVTVRGKVALVKVRVRTAAGVVGPWSAWRTVAMR